MWCTTLLEDPNVNGAHPKRADARALSLVDGGGLRYRRRPRLWSLSERGLCYSSASWLSIRGATGRRAYSRPRTLTRKELSGGNAHFRWLAQYIAAPPDRLDVVLAPRCVGELLAQLADEDVDDFHLGFVHAAVKLAQEHFLGER